MAEKYASVSPYAFCNNNPIRYIDSDGRKWVDTNGNSMWQNGQWTNYATKDARRVGIAMRATETGRKIFNHIANSPSAIQVSVSPNIIIRDNGKILTRGEFIPESTGSVITLGNGEKHPLGGTIMIYEGSINEELKGTIQSEEKTSNLIKSLPKEAALSGAIGSVGVHEGTHTMPKNIKQQIENSEAKEQNRPGPNDIEKDPINNQNKYLEELLNKDKNITL